MKKAIFTGPPKVTVVLPLNIYLKGNIVAKAVADIVLMVLIKKAIQLKHKHLKRFIGTIVDAINYQDKLKNQNYID